MKKIIFIAMLLFVTNNIIAQTNYYKEAKTFYEEGYTYQADVRPADVELYNKENKWIYVDSRYKDTGLFIDAVLEEYDVTILDEKVWKSARSTLHSIIANSFPEDVKEMSRASDYELFVILYINSQTGDVDEVSFSFNEESAETYNQSTLNGEIEAQYAQYVYNNILLEQGDTTVIKQRYSKRREAIKRLKDVIDHKGDLKTNISVTLLEERINFILTTFNESSTYSQSKYQYDDSRTVLSNFNHLQTITKDCP